MAHNGHMMAEGLFDTEYHWRMEIHPALSCANWLLLKNIPILDANLFRVIKWGNCKHVGGKITSPSPTILKI